jgi:hypothetical protein
MSDVAITATITGPTASCDLRSIYTDQPYLAPLEGLIVTDPENLIVIGRTWVRNIVKGNFSHGGAQVNKVLDIDKGTMTVMAMSATSEGIQSYLTTLSNALDQAYFTFTVTLDSATYSWKCLGGADYTINMNRKYMHAKAPEIKVAFYRQPVPVSGPF